MNLLGIQILGILFAFFMLYMTFLYMKRKEFTTNESLFWYGIWVVFLILVIVPTILDFFVIDLLDLNRRLDFFIIVGFLFLIALVFHNYLITRKTQNKVEKLVRNIALKKKKQ